MALIKCKMCGGDLEIAEGTTVAECEYCGSKQTVPSADNEKKLTLFSRANRLRLAGEFDKAAGVYENIVAEFPTEAEAYWGLVLCRYGIEYVDDPADGKKVPTCHRSSFDSILEDSDFEQACENADAVARRVYRDEAKVIEEIRKGVLEVSGKEEPYDIFICYKETDENGDRTVDSVLAQDVYDALTDKGYRVFFSRITLEDRLGSEYEPYIFAALNSAKIMLAFGTDYEYYNAVWVKNEWSRYLKLMEKDKSKYLIPCYKGIDAYDMPKEFAKLQAQDMGKVGAIQDLLRGIEKIMPKEEIQNKVLEKTVQISTAPSVDSLLKRGKIYLEDKNWQKADEYFDKVLDIDPECGYAYFGKVLVFYRMAVLDGSHHYIFDFAGCNEFRRAEQFADPGLKKLLDEIKAANELNIAKSRLINVMKQRSENLRTQELLEKELALKKQREEEQEKDKKEREEAKIKLKPIRPFVKGCLAASADHIVGLCSNGRVLAVGKNEDGQCRVSAWCDIVEIAVGSSHTVGLRADGTVLAAGKNEDGQCNVSDWHDIRSVFAGNWYTVGICMNGTVVATGEIKNEGICKIARWRDVVSISTNAYSIVGLKKDGSVLVAGEASKSIGDRLNWKNIIKVSVEGDLYHGRICGIKEDGTAKTIIYGDLSGLLPRVRSHWEEASRYAENLGNSSIAIKGDETKIVCLKSTGEVKSNYYRFFGGENGGVELAGDGSVFLRADGTVGSDTKTGANNWRNIVAICYRYPFIVGLKSDGTVLAVSKNDKEQWDVSDWRLFDSAETLKEEWKALRLTPLQNQKAALEAELSRLKGLFTFSRKREISQKLETIEEKIKYYEQRII